MSSDRSDVLRRLGAGLVLLAVVATAAWWLWPRPPTPGQAGSGQAGSGQAAGPPTGPGDEAATAAVRRGGDLLLARPGPLQATLVDPEGTELARAEGRTDGEVRINLAGISGTANPEGTVTIEGTTVPLGAPPFDGPSLVAATRSGPATHSGDHYVVTVEGRPLEVWLGPSGRIIRLAGTDADGVRMDVRLDE